MNHWVGRPRDGRYAAALWLALVVPSVYVVHKYVGWLGVLVHGAATAAMVGRFWRSRLQVPERRVFRFAAATIVTVTILFLIIYPMVNHHEPGLGSDDDDAYNVGAWALLSGHSPYVERTYLGNPLSPLPGAFLLAMPFVLVGTSAVQNLFWLAMFFLVVRRETEDSWRTLELAWLLLVFSPVVMHGVVTGTAQVANTIYVLLGLWWLTRTPHSNVAAVSWGVALASRANFILLLPLAFGWLRQRAGWWPAVRTTALSGGTVLGLSLPLYLHDPSNFGPLHAADRLLRLDAIIPYAGVGTGAGMAALAIGLAATSMDRASLFRNCASVPALPVAVGLVLTGLWGEPDLSYAAYGTFSAWFVLMALVLRRVKSGDADGPYPWPRSKSCMKATRASMPSSGNAL